MRHWQKTDALACQVSLSGRITHMSLHFHYICTGVKIPINRSRLEIVYEECLDCEVDWLHKSGKLLK